MKARIKQHVADSLEGFSLPRYADLPAMGLYLEQVVQYVNAATGPLDLPPLTASMVSNYVKQGLVDKPVKKRYDADQLAYFIFISVTKNVLSIDNLRLFIGMQKRTYTAEVAYGYFCDQLELALEYVLGRAEQLEDTGVTESEEKTMLRYACIAAANVVYLGKCFDAARDMDVFGEQGAVFAQPEE